MYLQHFGLNVAPFGLSHKLSFLYRSAPFQESMAHLLYGLDNREPIILITGPIGSGKTMALQSFLTNLGERYSSALVTNTKVTAIELLKLVLDDLGVDLQPGADKSDLIILLKDFLIRAGREGRKVLIVIDEAQDLSGDVLEEIRLLTNLGQGEEQPVQIVLAGQPELEELVERPELAQLRQRIRVHYKVEPMSRREVEEYVNHRMRIAGCTHAAFSTEALDRIYRLSGGIPRLVNTYCADGLLAAYVADRKKVEAGHVGPADGDGMAAAATRAPSPAAEPRPAQPARDPVGAGPADHRPPPLREPLMASRRGRRGPARPIWWALAIIAVAAVALYATGNLGMLRETVQDWLSVRGTAGPAPGAATVAPQPARPDTVAMTVVPADTAVVVPPPPAAPPSDAAVAVPDTARAKTPAAPTGGFYVHVSSFRTEDRADTYVQRWHRAGIPAMHVAATIRGVQWYRVYLGPYPSRERAAAVADSLDGAHDISYRRVVELKAGANG